MSLQKSKKWSFLEKCQEWPVVKVTIVNTTGSSPRANDCFMIVHDGDHHYPFYGSIGGGRLEFQAIKGARELINKGINQDKSWVRRVETILLNPTFGQCCGGKVEVLYERISEKERISYQTLIKKSKNQGEILIPFKTGLPIKWHEGKGLKDSPDNLVNLGEDSQTEKHHSETIAEKRPVLYLYGAGHVGRAITYCLKPLDWHCYWLDTEKNRFPKDAEQYGEIIVSSNFKKIAKNSQPGSFHLIMTYDHLIDFVVVETLLTNNNNFAYLGLIGSKTKANWFRKGLKELGLPIKAIDQLKCPIGIEGIKSKEPEKIAVSVVAEMLKVLDG